MTYKKYIVIFLLLFSQFCFSQNLITNGSFEDSLGNPSLNGWYKWGNPIDTSFNDTIFYNSSNDVPGGSGLWSVRLATAMPQSNHLAWFITGIQGTYIYKLSMWAYKTLPYYLPYTPVVALGIIDSTYYSNGAFYGNNPSIQGTIYDSIPFTWNKIIIMDTLTTLSTDTIAVILMGGATMNGPFDYVYYDLVELIVIDTLTLTNSKRPPKSADTKIYPYPIFEQTTIKFKNPMRDNIIFSLFTTTGHIIKNVETSNTFITVEKRNLSPGLYFYQFIDKNNGILYQQGKFLIQ